MDEKTKQRRQTAASHKKRLDALEAWAEAMTDHHNHLQDQQLVQHVQFSAVRELLLEGRPITKESLEERSRTIYESLKTAMQEANVDAVSETESARSESSAEGLVAQPSEVSAG